MTDCPCCAPSVHERLNNYILCAIQCRKCSRVLACLQRWNSLRVIISKNAALLSAEASTLHNGPFCDLMVHFCGLQRDNSAKPCSAFTCRSSFLQALPHRCLSRCLQASHRLRFHLRPTSRPSSLQRSHTFLRSIVDALFIQAGGLSKSCVETASAYLKPALSCSNP